MHGIIYERSQGLIDSAVIFGNKAHGDQVRKYTGEPYINHPIAVAKIVMGCDYYDVDMVVAAILHDVIEDTPVTREDIIDAGFGGGVADLVVELSDASRPEDGNRATRKAIDREFLSAVSNRAKTVKLADLINNSESITEYDPDFAKVYMKEKQLLLEVLHGGDAELMERANQIIIDYYLGPK